MTFQIGNTLGSLNKGHRDYLTKQHRIAMGPKISAAKKGIPLSPIQRASLQRYWESKKGKPVNEPHGKIITCPICNTQKYKYPRDLVRVKTNFCSKPCAYKFRDKGKTSVAMRIRDSKPYIVWRKHVFNRDGYTCQACNKRGGKLVADHELSFANFPALRFEILNGRTLCRPCHLKTPNYGTRATLDRTL